MTTYTAIANTEIDAESPITDLLLTRFRDNPLAVFEADPTAPAALLPTVFLGTINTTSGSTQTLSGLSLAPYKFLICTLNGVSMTGAANITLNSVIIGATTAGTGQVYGTVMVDLINGAATASTGGTNATPTVIGLASGLSNASTSISFSTPGLFDAGSIRVYGAK